MAAAKSWALSRGKLERIAVILPVRNRLDGMRDKDSPHANFQSML
jgi:hypothetical protein